MFYHAGTNGFFDPELGSVPDGSLPINDAEYRALLFAQASGQRILPSEDGTPTAMPYPPLSLGALQAAAMGVMTDWIERFLSQFTAGTPAAEMASWPTKSIAAQAQLAGIPQDIIQGEALLTGEDPNVLAATVHAKSQLYIAIIARMTGLRRMAARNISAAHNPEDLAAALDDALATAHQLVADLGLSQEN